MRVGFTGTRNGMTGQQKRAVADLLERLKPVALHHGDCVGADADCFNICREVSPQTHIIAWPADSDAYRAFTDSDEIRDPQPPLGRNKEIVRFSDELIATPVSPREYRRSGTWATVRDARTNGKRIHIVLPRGRVETEDFASEQKGS